jgi:hypothetical protein
LLYLSLRGVDAFVVDWCGGGYDNGDDDYDEDDDDDGESIEVSSRRRRVNDDRTDDGDAVDPTAVSLSFMAAAKRMIVYGHSVLLANHASNASAGAAAGSGGSNSASHSHIISSNFGDDIEKKLINLHSVIVNISLLIQTTPGSSGNVFNIEDAATTISSCIINDVAAFDQSLLRRWVGQNGYIVAAMLRINTSPILSAVTPASATSKSSSSLPSATPPPAAAAAAPAASSIILPSSSLDGRRVSSRSHASNSIGRAHGVSVGSSGSINSISNNSSNNNNNNNNNSSNNSNNNSPRSVGSNNPVVEVRRPSVLRKPNSNNIVINISGNNSNQIISNNSGSGHTSGIIRRSSVLSTSSGSVVALLAGEGSLPGLFNAIPATAGGGYGELSSATSQHSFSMGSDASSVDGGGGGVGDDDDVLGGGAGGGGGGSGGGGMGNESLRRLRYAYSNGDVYEGDCVRVDSSAAGVNGELINDAGVFYMRQGRGIIIISLSLSLSLSSFFW